MRILKIAIAIAALAAVVCVRAAEAAPPPLEAYGRLPAISAVALSPSGERFAVVAADKDGRKIIVRTSTGDPVAVVGFGAAKVRDVEFAGEDHLLIFETATVNRFASDYEVEGVIDLNLKTRASQMIFGKSATFYDVVFGWHGAREIGGRWYGFVGGIPLGKQASGREQVIFPDLYRVDLETGSAELVASSSEHARGWLIDAAGRVIANSRYDGDRGQWSVYGGAGSDHLLMQRDGRDALSFVSEGRTPGTIVVKERVGQATDLRELPLNGQGEGVVLLQDEIGSHAIFDPDTLLLVGLNNAARQAALFDPTLQKRIDGSRLAFGTDQSHLINHSRDFRRMIFLTDGPHNAGRYWLVDAADRTATPIGDIYPEVPPAEIGATKMFAFKASDGLAMEGALTLPPGRDPKALPLVVMAHRGPIVEGARTEFDWWVQAFASRGYAVLEPNYRGTQGYGDDFRKAADGQLNRKMQTDLSDGVAALAKTGVVDSKRACIVGADFGGYMALAGVTLQQGLYRCAVSVAGPSDINRWLFWRRQRDSITSQQAAQTLWRNLSGNKSGDIDSPSPLTAAAKADAPILLVHGEKDTTVSVDDSRLMQKALTSAGKPVEFVAMDGEDHGLSNAPTRLAMLKAVVAFVQAHNPAD